MLLEALRLGASLSAGFLNATPLQAAYAIVAARNVGARTPVPYAMGRSHSYKRPSACRAVALNGAVWTVYGVIVRNWVPLVLANSIGVVSGVSALVTFRVYADSRGSHYAGKLLGAYSVVVFAVLGVMQYAIVEPSAYPAMRSTFGASCVCVTIGMYASPLVTVREVLRTGSTAALSPVMTLASLLSSWFWFIYGVVIADANVRPPYLKQLRQMHSPSQVWFPNVAGLLLSLFQVVLFVRFRNHHTNGHYRPTVNSRLDTHTGKIPSNV